MDMVQVWAQERPVEWSRSHFRLPFGTADGVMSAFRFEHSPVPRATADGFISAFRCEHSVPLDLHTGPLETIDGVFLAVRFEHSPLSDLAQKLTLVQKSAKKWLNNWLENG